MKRRNSYILASLAALLLTGGSVTGVHAAFDENLNTYTLDAVVVNADRTKTSLAIRLRSSLIIAPVVM